MTSSRSAVTQPPRPWTGETYYGRPQLKPAPFEPWIVGGYIYLAGLSGASALIGALAEAEAMRRPSQIRRERRPLVRRSRYLSLLAPTVGSALLVYDLHTPSRFYNMFRVAKKTSPMSIGTWILTAFSVFAGVAGASQIVSDVKPRWRWPRRLGAAAQIPAACAGAGLSTYTAALLAATSTPAWAAAPRALAMRFASSSIATAAGALCVRETSATTQRSLSNLLLAALTTELAATIATDVRLKRAGIADAGAGRWGLFEKIGATGLGVMLPIGLTLASRLTRNRTLATAAGAAALAGSAAMRVSTLGIGIDSAKQPALSMRFAQPDNLPAAERSTSVARKRRAQSDR